MRGCVSRDLDFLAGASRQRSLNWMALFAGVIGVAAAFHHQAELQQRADEVSQREQSLQSELRLRQKKPARNPDRGVAANRAMSQFAEELCHPWASILADIENAASESAKDDHGGISIVAFAHDSGANNAARESGALTLEADTDEADAAHGFADDLAAMPGIGDAQVVLLAPNAGAPGKRRLRFRIEAQVQRVTTCSEVGLSGAKS